MLLISLELEGADSHRLSCLTAAEREVVALAERGHSNEAIAKLRGCAVRTVANQLAASYRKLAIDGRRQLKAKLREQP
ncbi:MAG TPA: LuxR C-terminal-related transcriptional regulator [Polyangiaceae bacterium]